MEQTLFGVEPDNDGLPSVSLAASDASATSVAMRESVVTALFDLQNLFNAEQVADDNPAMQFYSRTGIGYATARPTNFE